MNEILPCCEGEYGVLAGIWERSVRATHGFLGEDDFAAIREVLVPEYFPAVELYVLKADGVPAAFVGLSGGKIEMLFVDDCLRGHGFGTELIDFALSRGATSVDVNEQNPAALEFYLRRGFRVVGRDATDDSGRPYPILHLEL